VLIASGLFFTAGLLAALGASGAFIWHTLGQGKVARQLGTLLAGFTVAFLGLSLLLRSVAAGHAPFANQYEFSVAFAWGIAAAYLYADRRWGARSLGIVVMPLAALVLAFASTLSARADPLVPALQNSLLLTLHVSVAIVAYGTFAVAFGAAVLYLLRPKSSLGNEGWLLDEIAYRSVMIGFPTMGLVIVLGAVWANIAWGRYWGWDPKETSSLVTWLIYGGYLHARGTRGWVGAPSALLLVLGFGAVLLTFFGNYFFGGLHAYVGLG